MPDSPTDPGHHGPLTDLVTRLDAVADAGNAAHMRRYMRDRFEFLGVKTPARRATSASLVRDSRSWPVDTVRALVDDLRAHRHREFHYVASDVLRANDRRLTPAHLDDVRRWITTDAWWDTVDAIASPTVGTMASGHPEVVVTLDEWIDDDDRWLARTALLHQLRFGGATDADRLFGYSLRRAGDADVFIRKAIGWALRQYARTDPAAVRRFVAAHRDSLSTLTIREATKHLGAPADGPD